MTRRRGKFVFQGWLSKPAFLVDHEQAHEHRPMGDGVILLLIKDEEDIDLEDDSSDDDKGDGQNDEHLHLLPPHMGPLPSVSNLDDSCAESVYGVDDALESDLLVSSIARDTRVDEERLVEKPD
ncbi:hypothetical protein L6452_36241 [Arctium lappa]|uniref:Uncharacterized protein n=1 Tax=Arctium lappa TaxID=4217 RepID=A0ACB8Y8Q2_ARCLA|nr:hypothetical protein L6452_36241 [Arctium lappa]